MANSRKATKRAPAPPALPAESEGKYAPTSWGSSGSGGLEDLTVPSGQLCLIRRPGVQGLVVAGVLHSVDSLTSIVDKKHVIKGTNGKPDDINVESLMSDPNGLQDVMSVVDRVVCYCVVRPEIHETPKEDVKREPGVIYCDMIDVVDRMFIFAFVVGGTRDLETFRRGLDEIVGGLDSGEGVSQASE